MERRTNERRTKKKRFIFKSRCFSHFATAFKPNKRHNNAHSMNNYVFHSNYNSLLPMDTVPRAPNDTLSFTSAADESYVLNAWERRTLTFS